MMTIRKLSTAAGVLALAALTACSSAPERRVISEAPVRAEYPVRTDPMGAMYGQVRAITVVPESSRSGAAGAVLGAVVGAVVGNQIGSGSGRAAATGIGAVGGAVAGNQIAKRNADDVYRVEVRMDDGSVRTFDFRDVGDLRIGDRVRFDGAQLYRV